MKKIVVFFALALISLPIFAGEFEQQIQSIVTKYKLPGASVLRSQNGKIDVGEVVGVRKLGDTTKISSNDKFHLGSCTKAMTATLVAKLIEEGRLTWTTTAHDVLGKVHQDHQNVTIEMLLAHRGGTTGDLLKYRDGDLWKKLWNQSLNPMSGRQLVFEEVMGYKADATPGTQYIYSNAGYIIAGAMLEKITGKSWETLMREKIFMPLSMHSCGFGAPAAVSEIPDQP